MSRRAKNSDSSTCPVCLALSRYVRGRCHSLRHLRIVEFVVVVVVGGGGAAAARLLVIVGADLLTATQQLDENVNVESQATSFDQL